MLERYDDVRPLQKSVLTRCGFPALIEFSHLVRRSRQHPLARFFSTVFAPSRFHLTSTLFVTPFYFYFSSAGTAPYSRREMIIRSEDINFKGGRDYFVIILRSAIHSRGDAE